MKYVWINFIKNTVMPCTPTTHFSITSRIRTSLCQTCAMVKKKIWNTHSLHGKQKQINIEQFKVAINNLWYFSIFSDIRDGGDCDPDPITKKYDEKFCVYDLTGSSPTSLVAVVTRDDVLWTFFLIMLFSYNIQNMNILLFCARKGWSILRWL